MTTNQSPLVTIYVPSHNYGRFLRQSLDSVLRQMYQNWELFIIDEGSDDDTALIGEEFALKDPKRIRFIRHETPHGLQRCANEILGLAQGKYIFRLDGDDWLDESALLVLMTRAEMDEQVGIVFGSFYYVDEAGDIVGLERQMKLWDEDKSGINPPHGACTLVKTRALKAVGGYSEDINAQDGWELWFKLQGRTAAASVTTPVFFYRQHGNSLSRSADRLYSARAKIFSKIRTRLSGSFVPKVLGVIPVRESYPHFQNVPYAKVGSKTVLERAIFEAQAAGSITDVLVTADSPSVVSHCEDLERNGLVQPHLKVCRPSRLNGDHIHLIEILKHAGKQYQILTGQYPDIVLFLNLHAVLRTRTTISKAVDTILVTEADTIVSVVEERNPVFVHSESGLKLIGNGRFDNLLYKKEQLLRFSGGIIAAWWDVVDQGSIWGGRTGFIEMLETETDILRTSEDLPRFSKRLIQVKDFNS